jgi:hypothetical protein
VHINNKVHLGKMNKKVHLAKMHRLYVGIRKNHMDQIKKNKKVHLAEMHFFVHFLKVGLFTPALVIDSVQTIIFQVPQVPHTPQHPFTPRVRYDRVIHTATKPKTQHDHIPQQTWHLITAAAASSVAASAPSSHRHGRSPPPSL